MQKEEFKTFWGELGEEGFEVVGEERDEVDEAGLVGGEEGRREGHR